jgi:6-pyruvoyl-tetrahydropterin synthase
LEKLSQIQEKHRVKMFIKDLMTVDVAIFVPAKGVIGRSWYIDLTLEGLKDENGFIYDFSKIKSLARNVIKDTLDHTLVIPIYSQDVSYSESAHGEQWSLLVKETRTHPDFCWHYRCPKGAVFPVSGMSVTPTHLEMELSKILRHRLPDSIHHVEIGLREGSLPLSEAKIRYTHGLPLHDGPCQRLFHGHDSRIEVYVGAERRGDLEHYVARELLGNDVHIATPDQIIEGPKELGRMAGDWQPVTLSYLAKEGHFEAVIPACKLFNVRHTTSIESITAEIAEILHEKENPQEALKVICYEGLDKGAVCIL